MHPVASRAVELHRRLGRRLFWSAWALILVIAAFAYAAKAAESRSAFVRWRHQVLELIQGRNIKVYEDMMFPNPPIMPITLYPLMTLPPVAGATAWFVIKCGLATVSALLCFRMARARDQRFPAWAEGLVLLLSLRPILSDLHHGNINLMILFLVVAALYAWRNGYDATAGLLLALSISYKVTPALFVPYFMYKRSWRTVFYAGFGMALFLLAVPSVVLGPTFNVQCLQMWWHRILSPYIASDFVSSQEMNQSMAGVLTRLMTSGPVSTGRYDRHIQVNLVAWNPARVTLLMKGLSLAMVGLLAYLCRTKTRRRDDPRLLGEFALVVLTMLIVSERSWKHHFVTLLLPYTYLVYRIAVDRPPARVRRTIAAALAASALLMATTSSELGGLVGGHKLAQAYGMFLWSAVVLYAATAWRVRVEGREEPEGADAGPGGGRGPFPYRPHLVSATARSTAT